MLPPLLHTVCRVLAADCSLALCSCQTKEVRLALDATKKAEQRSARAFAASLRHVRTLGTTGEAGDGELQFNRPTCVAVEAGEAGLVYVADCSNDRVQVWGAP